MPQNLEDLTISEVSLVDRPANSEHGIPRARVALFKRDDSVEKGEGVDDLNWDEKDEICKAVDGGAEFLGLKFVGGVLVAKGGDPFNGELVVKEGKTYDGTTFPKSDFAYTPDDTPSHWKLRLTKSPGGKPDAGIVGAAIAAIGKGFRGKKVQIPSSALAAVKTKVRAAWTKANPDKGSSEMPDVLKGNTNMTLEDIEKKQNAQDAELEVLKADRLFLASENEVVLKMSKKERKAYASMDADERKAFMAGDADKRKGMIAGAQSKQKEKAVADSMDAATCKRYEQAGPVEKAAMLKEQEAALEKARKAKGGKDVEDDDGPDGDDDADDAKKQLTLKLAQADDRITKAEQALDTIRKHSRVVDFAKMAETELPNSPGNPEEKGTRLMKAADAFGGTESEDFKQHLDTLKKADKALKENHFVEIGKSGVQDVPIAKVLEAKAQEIAKRDKTDLGHAMAKAMEENPELYFEYEKAHGRDYQRM